MTSANDLLMNAGIPSFSYKNMPVGTSFTGIVDREPEMRQQTDYVEKGKPLFWPDGSPKMQVVVTVDTDYRDSTKPNDDGKRRWYLRWHSLDAVRAAIRESGADGLHAGGKLTLTFSGTEPSNKGEPAKLYTAVYVPPLSGGNEALMNESQTAQAEAPASAGQSAPAPSAVSAAELIAKLSDEDKKRLGIA